MATTSATGRRIRYGVVGGGWISQGYFMPGVARTGNSELTALVTGDPEKGRVLGGTYGLAQVCGYDGYAALLRSGAMDALYIALPNGMHRDFAVPALEAGLHVLLEKPMAVSEAECEEIEAAARRGGAKLMVAYRLHCEPATLQAIRLVREGAIGTPLVFGSVFTQHVDPRNHRARQGFWAGPVADMGPYPVNAVRNLFGAEPIEVTAFGARRAGFDFDDTVTAILRFPGGELAQLTVSYAAEGMNGVGTYRVAGTTGDLVVVPGYSLEEGLTHRLTVNGRTSENAFPATDQFAGETRYFSDCILNGYDPEPDGEEGRCDVRVLAAIERALATGRPQTLQPLERRRRPEPAQAVVIPHEPPPGLVHAAAPQKG
ncbi:Gfo/Idh/MocA family oxidoreductase [Roseomonas sp. NAR14]|uniref:Gfo/Idh/MocA family oxidoreductase n=1 Tax=Roseomonas acroporae TaxID=2937791 RepID=A0A9X2BUH7_9PROT|nr:Gfo/Idh/MocA family oxidoreductase [Roseomonas acroporae]MCK8785653.1 Gfo/Idh/MocA family oxidoreductase [Roseomonas acroporae]